MIKVHLAEIMARKEIKVKDLAKKAEISERTIIDLKKNRNKNVNMDRVMNNICKVLKCSVGEIFEYIPE
jgi:DNA-binding Xre family transcriptional regulator